MLNLSVVGNPLKDEGFMSAAVAEGKGLSLIHISVRTLCSGEEIIADKNRCAFPQWHPRVTGGEADCLCPALGKQIGRAHV